MKVFNLSCEFEHAFEGWFASAADYDAQLARALIECPVCGSTAIRKMPAAPRLNLSPAQPPAGPVSAPGAADARQAPSRERLRAAWLKMARYIVEHTEDVGEQFAEEARRIHYDEAPERWIRGVASREETQALADEGIDVIAFPLPKRPSGPLQ